MWLLKHGLAEQLEHARRTLAATEEQQLRFREATSSAASARLPRIARTAGSNMEIAVEGILTKKPDFWAWLFYGANTAYRDIQSALAVAEQDAAIKSVVLSVDSPGGSVDGLFELLASLEVFPKKVEVKASLAASAAYAIAAVAPGKVTATNVAAVFGSVGVAASYLVDDAIVEIASTDAPNKRPDVTTDEGKAIVRQELDAIHQLFVETIARGRGTTVANVNQNFGRGGVVLAQDAKRRGMIDAVKSARPAPRRASAESEGPTRKETMTNNEVSQTADQHRDAFGARVLAVMLRKRGREDEARALEEAHGSPEQFAQPVQPAPTVTTGKDLGDQVADVMAQRRGKRVA